MKKIYCICFSATFQRSITFDSVKLEHVNRSKTYRLDASGKAVNTARVLQQLQDGCTKAFCPLGKKDRKEFCELAKADGFLIDYVEIPGKTRECWTLLDSSAETTTELVVGEPALERTEDFIKMEEELRTSTLEKNFADFDGVLLAGSRPSGWSTDLYPQIAKKAVESGKIFLADYIGEDLINTLKICTPTIIKINDEEFCKTFGLEYPASDSDLQKAITEKSNELQNIIVVTRGIKSTYGAIKGQFAECPTEKVKAVNTTACGDSFNAGFIYEYVNSQDFEKALKKGTWCAARNAERECPGSVI